jgi:hypothetical protein
MKSLVFPLMSYNVAPVDLWHHGGCCCHGNHSYPIERLEQKGSSESTYQSFSDL